jgi:hypothetical protein
VFDGAEGVKDVNSAYFVQYFMQQSTDPVSSWEKGLE